MSMVESLRKHFRMAFKSVLASKKEYGAFFAAVLLVQILLGVCTVAYLNNNAIEKAAATSSYDYHFAMENLSEDQFFYIVNVQTREQEKDWIFDFKYAERATPSGAKRYTVYVTLRGDEDEAGELYEAFLSRYGGALEEAGTVTYSATPLLTYAEGVQGNRGTFWGLLLLCLALSILLLTILYRVRLDHFKFDYGVYLSFGADFKTLLRMSVCEMLVIAALTALPGLLLSYGIGALLYIGSGGLHGFYLLPLLTVLLGSAIAVVAAVFLPVLHLSHGRPSRLLIAEDNSHFASSPRHSARIPDKKMPTEIALLGAFRFRKYYIRLLFAGCLFGMLLVVGGYLAECYDRQADLPVADYAVDFTATGVSADSAAAVLSEVEGVCAVTRSTGVSAATLDSNMLVPKQTVCGGDFVPYSRNSDWQGSMMLRYAPADETTISVMRDFYGYEIEGDPSLILTDERAVILSDSADNRQVLDIHPGEKVLLSTECHVLRLLETETNRFGFTVALSGGALLRSYFDACDFSYREYTVAAVIHGMPSDEELAVYFSFDGYRSLTGKKPTAKQAAVYLEKGIGEEERERIAGLLLGLQDRYPGMRLTETGAAEKQQTEGQKNMSWLFRTLSILLFAVCPIIWFFSQWLFYRKRENELDVFRALGAIMKEISGVFITDGILLGILSALLYTGLSYGAVALCREIMNRCWFVRLIGGEAGVIRYPMHLPTVMFIIGLVCSFFFAFAASWLARRRYCKKADEHISSSFSEE